MTVLERYYQQDFAYLVNEVYSTIPRYSRLHSKEVAEDIVQDAFVRCLTKCYVPTRKLLKLMVKDRLYALVHKGTGAGKRITVKCECMQKSLHSVFADDGSDIDFEDPYWSEDLLVAVVDIRDRIRNPVQVEVPPRPETTRGRKRTLSVQNETAIAVEFNKHGSTSKLAEKYGVSEATIRRTIGKLRRAA